jgi:RND family efflux transporter MFP subunit
MPIVGLALVATGCTRGPASAPPAPPISASVSHPVREYVTDYAEFTARIAAVDSVEVRAHVWGYLDKVKFKEGDLVKKGDVLFEIDARPYQATFDAAEAQVAQNVASHLLAKQNNTRFRGLAKANAGAVTRLDLDQYQSQEEQAAANLARARANLETAKLNLDWTKVRAPVSGRASNYNVTVGNLIQSGNLAGGTRLTTIVSVDPIHAYFEVDELTVQRVRQLIREGKLKSSRGTAVPVSLGLAAEDGFPHQGIVNFVDNQLNPSTGTMRTRGVFPNKDELLSAGFFARVRVPVGPAHEGLLVSDRALDNDQGQKIVYVVNDKNQVVARPVRAGALHDGLREIEQGLNPGDRVVVSGLLQIRPGMTVEPKLVAMPRPNARRSKPGGIASSAPALAGKSTPDPTTKD